MSRLVKIESDKKIAGVCSGLARYFGFDVTLVRVIFVAGALFGFGSFVLLYLILMILMPKN